MTPTDCNENEFRVRKYSKDSLAKFWWTATGIVLKKYTISEAKNLSAVSLTFRGNADWDNRLPAISFYQILKNPDFLLYKYS